MTMDKVDYRDLLMHPVDAFVLIRNKIKAMREQGDPEAIKWEYVLHKLVVAVNVSSLNKEVLSTDEHKEMLDRPMWSLETYKLEGVMLAMGVPYPDCGVMHKWIVQELHELMERYSGSKKVQQWTAFEHLWSWLFKVMEDE